MAFPDRYQKKPDRFHAPGRRPGSQREGRPDDASFSPAAAYWLKTQAYLSPQIMLLCSISNIYVFLRTLQCGTTIRPAVRK